MVSRPFFLLATAGILVIAPHMRGEEFHAPDSLVLKNGETVHGLIIKNSVDNVLMQEKYEERSYPKSEIVRILDEPDIGIAFTDLERKGSLPSWRVIANDLRTHDAIKSLIQIPATAITIGDFKNVPYLSFRVNRDIEMNIYGDPSDPAGLELGIYGSRVGDSKLQHTLRAYIAGYLTTRAELAALYSLDFKGGLKKAGEITFEITPKTAPDAYGAWWISLYNVKALAQARLTDARYAALTKPASEVIDNHGRVLAENWTSKELSQSERLQKLHGRASILPRGFYRDSNGDFRILH
jgi:hypothetical protein